MVWLGLTKKICSNAAHYYLHFLRSGKNRKLRHISSEVWYTKTTRGIELVPLVVYMARLKTNFQI